MSIYTKIYTLDKILRKVENNNTVILTDKKKRLLSIHCRVYNSYTIIRNIL